MTGGSETHRWSAAEAAGDFADLFRQALGRHAGCLEQRRRAGKVRRCHGDLILRNICLIDGVPTLFDCLEFNEALATIDVLYDLAFLLMDLWHRDQREFANLVYNRYLDECDEADGLDAGSLLYGNPCRRPRTRYSGSGRRCTARITGAPPHGSPGLFRSRD